MNKQLNTINNLFKAIKDYSKTPSDWIKESKQAALCVESGDVIGFESLNNPKNKFLDKHEMLSKACRAGNLSMYQYLLQKREYQIDNGAIINASSNLITASVCDHLNIVKFILSKENPLLAHVDKYYENSCCFRAAAKEKNIGILTYLIEEHSYDITPQVQQWVKENASEEVLILIEKRLLQEKIALPSVSSVTKHKAMKI